MCHGLAVTARVCALAAGHFPLRMGIRHAFATWRVTRDCAVRRRAAGCAWVDAERASTYMTHTCECIRRQRRWTGGSGSCRLSQRSLIIRGRAYVYGRAAAGRRGAWPTHGRCQRQSHEDVDKREPQQPAAAPPDTADTAVGGRAASAISVLIIALCTACNVPNVYS